MRAVAVAAVTVLVIGLTQEPVARFGERSLKHVLLEPVEINPAARLPLLPETNLHALWFFEQNEGLAAGESGTLLRTMDGGATWQPARIQPGLDRDVGLYALTFESGGPLGHVGGKFSTTLQSADRGATWTQIPWGMPANQTAQKAAPQVVQPLQVDRTLPDVGSLVFTADHRLLTASRRGVGINNSWSETEIKGDIRGVAQDGVTQVFAGPTGLIIRQPDEKPGSPPTELMRPGAYTAMSARNGRVFAAGDRFRMERLGQPRQQQQPAVAGTGSGVVQFGNWYSAEAVREGDEAIPVIHGCAMAADGVGWAVGAGGAIWRVTPTWLVAGTEALTVRRCDVPEFEQTLYAVWAFSRDEAIVAGKNGALFRTRDGGDSWAAITRNCYPADQRGSWWLKVPAPWCWLALAALAGLGWRRWQRLPATVDERDAVAEELTSDRPLEPGEADRLGFDPLVQGLSRYLLNTATQAPLTLAVTGAWGAGKSSFMNLLRSDLDDKGLRTVWFNAWHHQQEPQILAPLLSAIQAEAAPPLLSAHFALALRFRWRLLRRRIWPPGKLVLWAAVFVGFLLGVGAALDWKMPSTVLSGTMVKLAGEKPWEAASELGFGTSALGALFLLGWQALKTFGVSPADLLATEVGKTSEEALSAQNKFRREFAAQFSEVTEALKPYPLVIFIDDLDRCEVPKVFQILEAINYLVSSGGCYVVLGMSEERVRDAVAIGFKDLPANFGEAEAPADVKPAAGAEATKPGSPPDPWARQRELAQNYLEKLVQLRIDVPRPNPESAKRLVRMEAAAAAEESSVGWWAAVAAWLRDYWFTLAAVGVVLVVLTASFQTGRWVGPLLGPVKTDVQKPQDESPGSTAGQSANTPGRQGNESGTPASTGHLYDDRGLAPTAPLPGHDARGGWIIGGFMVLVIVGAVWLAERLWQKRLSIVVRDSRDFNEACERWTDALHRLLGDRLTPRGLKRFKNRVRFYAMMRPKDGDKGLLSGVSDASLVALGAIELAGFIPLGQLDREDLDIKGLMESSIDGQLKDEAVEAFGVLQRDSESGRTMRTAKANLRRV